MTNPHSRNKALVLTVGTGNIDDLERTLLVPMLKSIERGEWERVVLLPSHTTNEFAQTLRARLADPAVEIERLQAAGQENDADACFGHFDAVLARLVADGFTSNDIEVDFTRGTKAMSAALVLAAVGQGIPILRYVHSEQRDERGMVVPGTEKVGEIRTTVATARRRLDQAKTFMRQGDFGAAIELLPDPDGPGAGLFPERFDAEARALRAAAHIYAAWDRLDYQAAAKAAAQHGSTATRAGAFALTPQMANWLRQLKQRPDSSSHAEMAAYLRALACDLLANAERRLRDQHFEDALLRSYRVLELIGQIRLFDRGYDSAALPPDDEQIKKFQADLEKKGERGFGDNKGGPNKGTLTAPRELAARLLKRLDDPLAQQLLKFDDGHSEAKTRSRNQSILVHGFGATAPAEARPLSKVLAGLADLLREDDPKAAERMKAARSLSFSGTSPSPQPSPTRGEGEPATADRSPVSDNLSHQG